MFALISMKNGKACISLKCDPFIAQSLRQQYPAITPGYHLNKEHWNTITVDGSVPDDEFIWMIDHLYELVYKSLSKAERKKLHNAE
jgi:predicted DNA-binding protein (MmcQ/YjbR family)